MASTDPQQQRQQFLQIAQHDKFYSKLLSKETSLASPSFCVYYGRASVPFVWESQPGTPKRLAVPTTPLLPLTPPPSYHSNPKRKTIYKKPTKSNLIRCLKRNPTLPDASTVSLSASTSSSSSSSLGSRGRRYSSRRSSFSSTAEDDDSAHRGSPKSTLRSGCYSMLFVKSALLSIVGSASQGPSAS